MTAGAPRQRVCILGGSGFLGRRLAGRLDAAGVITRIPTRSRFRHRDLTVLPSVELVAANVHDEATLGGLLAGCDAAINLVGILNEKGSDGAGFRRAHVELCEKLVRTCRANGVERLLYVSALKADADHGPSHYLRSKGAAERAIVAGAGAGGGGGVHYTIFRPSTMFGPGDSFLYRFEKLLRLTPFLPLPRADARFAPVYVEDVADAMLSALWDERTYGRSYELCGPEIFTLEEVVRFVARHSGRKRVVLPLPAPLGKLEAVIGGWLPGKPFSLDNYRSLGISSVCAEDGLTALGVGAHALTAVMPRHLERGRGKLRARHDLPG
jgi:NADH dehydrogenase